MTSGFLDGDVFRGLAFRILLFLSLALLPFGLIAVVQTRELADQASRNAERRWSRRPSGPRPPSARSSRRVSAWQRRLAR
ncbi:MAG: hypothetical protein HC814_08595 [Rhodobacteraceae bacterium]|nr:hypothetical protein [Paracoccaceae bacterium]